MTEKIEDARIGIRTDKGRVFPTEFVTGAPFNRKNRPDTPTWNFGSKYFVVLPNNMPVVPPETVKELYEAVGETLPEKYQKKLPTITVSSSSTSKRTSKTDSSDSKSSDSE